MNTKLGFEVMDSWGFKYQTMITWVKVKKDGNVGKDGLGFYFRGATEHILFGTKGRLIIPTDKRVPNVIHNRRCGHSVKPDIIYDIIENCSPSPYIELFARKRHDGWDCYGDELPDTIQKMIIKKDSYDYGRILFRNRNILS